MAHRPIVSLVASPTRRHSVLDLARRIEAEGFPGIACPALGGAFALAGSLAHVTSTLEFFTSIQPIYLGNPRETATTAAHIHEVSGGRFRLGLGVSHHAMMRRYGVDAVGSPLAAVRSYLAELRDAVQYSGELPPIWLATLRNRMLELALEVGDGALWANASRRHLAVQLQRIPASRRPTFPIANMIPTVITDDLDAARTIHRKTMMSYVVLPNYRNYWRECGYAAEMDAMEAALAAKERDRLPSLMTDAWLDDCTLSGPADAVVNSFDEWRSLGVTPIAVMSSTRGGQMVAIAELIEAYSSAD